MCVCVWEGGGGVLDGFLESYARVVCSLQNCFDSNYWLPFENMFICHTLDHDFDTVCIEYHLPLDIYVRFPDS